MLDILVPKKILLGLQEGYCNLKCPKCYTHGPHPVSKNSRPSGYMKTSDLIRILDEVAPYKPRIAPQTWDEPLLNPNLFDQLKEIKLRGLTVTMDTNGLLLNEETAMRLIELKIDSVFISVDAVTPGTYKSVRGVDRLEELKKNIEAFVRLRGTAPFPRIGVSYVVENENSAEVQDFVTTWAKIVDVVRVNQQFMSNRTLLTRPATVRTPCWSLDDSLMIHFNGEASLCCVDTHYENKIGNVFKSGVLEVWNGAFFAEARRAHHAGDLSKLAICQKCDLWSHEKSVTTYTSDLMIVGTTSHTYYNRLDKMQTMPANRLAETK